METADWVCNFGYRDIYLPVAFPQACPETLEPFDAHPPAVSGVSGGSVFLVLAGEPVTPMRRSVRGAKLKTFVFNTISFRRRDVARTANHDIPKLPRPHRLVAPRPALINATQKNIHRERGARSSNPGRGFTSFDIVDSHISFCIVESTGCLTEETRAIIWAFLV